MDWHLNCQMNQMNMKYFPILLFLVCRSLLVSAITKDEFSDDTLKIQEGIASYYGERFHNRKTANGEIFDMNQMTAAHKYLPFGTMLKITNLKNGRQVWVMINDRLPQTSKRIIDLSKGAATELEMIRDGIVPVKIEVADQDVIYSLIDHFKDKKPKDLRLRFYESPIEIAKPSILNVKFDFFPALDLVVKQ